MRFNGAGTFLRWISLLYPPAFRRARWEDITATYRDGLEDGRPPFTWTLSVLVDLLVEAPASWLDAARARERNTPMDRRAAQTLARATLRVAVLSGLFWCGSLAAVTGYFRLGAMQLPWEGFWIGNLTSGSGQVNAQAALPEAGRTTRPGTLILRGWNLEAKTYVVATFHITAVDVDGGGLTLHSRVDRRGADALGLRTDRDVEWRLASLDPDHAVLRGDALVRLATAASLEPCAARTGVSILRPGTFRSIL